MIITRKKFIGPLQQVRCGNLTLDLTDVAKSLGVLIDNRLTWDSHIKKLSKSFSAQLKMLKRMKYLPVNQLEDIYFNMILPNVTYCISVWGSCSHALFEEIENLHMKAARQIHDVPTTYHDHQVLKRVKWHNLAYMYKKKVALEMFKVVSMENRLSSYFEVTKSSRRGNLLRMRRMNTEFGKQSLIFRGPVVWNSLNENIRKPVNINQFKAAIKKCKAMDDVSFIKGTCTNKNKNLEDFVYF